MDKNKMLVIKYKNFIMYTIFGILTTAVNLISYILCCNICNIPNILSTIIAWILAVGFAFITNKLWVFDSKSFGIVTLKYEVPTFLGARIITGIFDVVIMYFTVDVFNWNPIIWKLLSNVIVIILNYIASKFVIFKK